MPTKSEHLVTAAENQKTIHFLLPHLADHAPSVVTIAFYKAAHLVESVLAEDGMHFLTPIDRNRHLKENARLRHVYKHFRPLQDASEAARYHGGQSAQFSRYLPPGLIQSTILGHYLHQVEQGVGRLYKSP
jgi:hypothetical protein